MLDVFFKMINLQGTMLLLILVGVFASKRGYLDAPTRKHVTDLLINIILPFNIFGSFQQKFSPDMLAVFGTLLLISLVIQLFSIALSRIMYRRADPKRKNILRYGIATPNCNFMGLPVVEGVYGAEGLLYGSIWVIPVRVALWTYGTALFVNKIKPREVLLQVITHPCILAVFAGLFMMVTPLELPAFAAQAITYISRCSTAFSLIVIGSILAEVNVRDIFQKEIVGVGLVRLIAIPLAVIFALSALNVDPLIVGLSGIMTSMPFATTGAILAEKYGGDAHFASSCVFLTTVGSLVTVPVITLFLP